VDNVTCGADSDILCGVQALYEGKNKGNLTVKI
jgi:hypothetical protein